jgi:hypothetical protein
MKRLLSKIIDTFLFEPEQTDEGVLILRSFVRWGNDETTDPTNRKK